MLGWGIGVAAHGAPLVARTRGHATHGGTGRAAHVRNGPTSVHEVAASVGSERPSLRPAAAPDGTVTILFTDIEGSTQLNERLGDVQWLELLRAHHAIVRE